MLGGVKKGWSGRVCILDFALSYCAFTNTKDDYFEDAIFNEVKKQN